jgi:hypothetical protein
VRHDVYFLGEKGFVEIKYIGWITPFTIYGEKQRYEFDTDRRTKLIDKRDAEILIETIVDGVKIFAEI